jgi:Inner membrane component of T3SS, cytoplasmic domain
MNKECPNCGTRNREQAKHCIECNQVFADKNSPIRMCSAGRHLMDPGWSACPYCSDADAEIQEALRDNRAYPHRRPGNQAPTVIENTVQAKADNRKGKDEPAESTPVHSSNKPSRRRTIYSSDEISYETRSDSASGPSPSGGRRIVGVLITYSWNPDGQLFPIREGRNYIGSGQDCDVCVQEDKMISSRHFTIISRGRSFYIDDEKSMNGTYVNGESVEQKRPLHYYAKIKAGATVWKFVALDSETEDPTVDLHSNG